MPMKRELKDKWLAALRSGEYLQGVGRLYAAGCCCGEYQGVGRLYAAADGYCCLGVLAKVAGLPIYNLDGDGDGEVDIDGIGVTQEEAKKNKYSPIWQLVVNPEFSPNNSVAPIDFDGLIEMNDSGKSFTDIADKIEKQIVAVD